MITCLCPTIRSRRDWLGQAVACFLLQDFADREMLIVADDDCDLPRLLPGIRSMRVRPGLSIGEKRNIGCAAATGDLIAHWDDDDYYGPGRLSDQYRMLIESGRDVAGYHSMRFTDGVRWWNNRNAYSWAFDASLLYRKSFWELHRFAPINDGAEHHFKTLAWRESRLVTGDAGLQMYATIHAGNTSRRVIGEGWDELSASS
jgi:glycosyltransferase involved in cell wall biosynthesis